MGKSHGHQTGVYKTRRSSAAIAAAPGHALRHLRNDEIKRVTHKDAQQGAVESFLSTMPTSNKDKALEALEKQQIFMRYNKATIASILDGIKLASTKDVALTKFMRPTETGRI
jgi:hypothetical protein